MKLFSNHNKIQSLAYWTAFAKNKKRLIVFCEDDVFDLTEFAKIHPAGEKAISPYLLHDIKNIFFRVYPHSTKAFQTLKRYKCGQIKDLRKKSQEKVPCKGICKDKSNLLGKKQQQLKKVSFLPEERPPIKSKDIQVQIKAEAVSQQSSSNKNQENSINFEQNKPALIVPYFNTRIDCFAKQGKQSKKNISNVQEAS